MPRDPALRAPVIITDVPAPFETWGVRPGGIDSRSADAHYDTMTWPALNDLGYALDPVVADDCALFCWSFPPVLPEIMAMASAWGFTYKTKAFSWLKIYPSAAGFVVGMGYHTRANSEDVLLFTRGDPRRIHADVYQVLPEMRYGATRDAMQRLFNAAPPNARMRTVLGDLLVLLRTVADRQGHATLADLLAILDLIQTLEGGAETAMAILFEHSRKPEAIQDRIERLLTLPADGRRGFYLELFARRRRPGWVCLGNELSGHDIRRDLRELAWADAPPVEHPRPGLFPEATATPLFGPDEMPASRPKRRKKPAPGWGAA